ncbi:TetR/AcrR family transcriptional regulator [Hansschlegelia sp. KR7-227]|uniref:TetR/AcrR family transcriptional regulator n=1 Tax=Hansschlegelia sp. KR7-227 TaxID=3400914 RepID=UPI003BFF3CF4
MTGRGRPRAFDRDEALRRAMELFWAQGYEAASMTELTRAMGIASPSLYAAFGSKEALFREAIELYGRTVGAEIASAVAAAGSARGAVEAFLTASAEATTRPGRPPGCMVVLAAVQGGGGPSDDTCRELRATRQGVAAALERRLAEGVATGELPACLNLSAIASFYATVQQGMSIQARDGASRATLDAVAASAMAAWDALVAPGGQAAPIRPAEPAAAS